MSEQMFFVRVWVEGGEVRLVNSNTNPITFDVVEIEGSEVYDFDVSGDYMSSDQVMPNLSVSDGNLDCGSLVVSNLRKRS